MNTKYIKDGISEKVLEKKLTQALHTQGVWCEKYTNPFKAGYPDRLCLCRGGHSFWVEVKTTGEKPRLLQCMRIEELRRLGYTVFIVDTEEGINEVVTHAMKYQK